MRLSDGTNTISDARFQAAHKDLKDRQGDELDSAAEGRTEELPGQTRLRHAQEDRQLEDDRKTMSVAQWLNSHPDSATTHFLIAHEVIDNEIDRGLERKAELRNSGLDVARPTKENIEMPDDDKQTWATNYWRELASSGGGGGQAEFSELKQGPARSERDTETEEVARRQTARVR